MRSGLVVVETCRGGGAVARGAPGLGYGALTILMGRRYVWWQSRSGWQQEAAILRRHIVMVVILVDSSGNRIHLQCSFYLNDAFFEFIRIQYAAMIMFFIEVYR
jgi:hypothetical protein